MEYSRARGCIFTKILTILSVGRHCALSLWVWILARLDSLEFPMLDLNQVFNLLSVEKKDLSASQLETGSVFNTFSMGNKVGNIEGFISCKALSRLLEWLFSLSSPGCSCIVQVRSRRVKDLEVKTDKTLNSLKVYSWDQPGYEKLFSLVTSKANPWPLMLLEQISLLAAL